MLSVRRPALLALAGLGVTLLTALPASAAAPKTLPGTLVPLLRQAAPTGTRARVARPDAQAGVTGGSPAPARSQWNVTFTDNPDFADESQAEAAFTQAVNIWAGIVQSSIPITVSASFKDLGSGVLGYAGPTGFTTVPGHGSTYYPDALADALAGSHITTDASDITAQFSSTEPKIYYGTDGNPPAGYSDFESTVLHELGHGLGFIGTSTYTSSTNASYSSPPVIFDTFNANASGTSLVGMTAAQLASAFTSNAVYWNGSQGTAANGGSMPRLYAPNPWQDGSSISHLDESTYPDGTINSLMTPYLTDGDSIHNPGPMMVGMMRDLGWVAALGVPGAPANVTGAGQTTSIAATWTAPSADGTAITGYTISATGGGTTVTTTAGPTATSATISGLTSGISYDVSVTATNDLGTGPAGTTSTPVLVGQDTTPPTVSITSPTNGGMTKATGSIAFVGADTGNAPSTISYTCSLDGAAASACTSPVAYSGLVDGSSHTFSVTPTDAAGNVGTSATVSWTVDTEPPTVTLTSKPAAIITSTSASFGFSGTDNSGQPTFVCQLDSAPVTSCTSPVTYNGLSNAAHTFKVAAQDAAGNLSPSAAASFRVDTIDPTVGASALPTFTTATSVAFHYAGADSGSGVASYDVRYRRAAFNTGFGAYTAPSGWSATTATARTLTLSGGYTYCFSVRSRDRAGHVSAYSAERCIGSTLDDRSLVASAGWTRGTNSHDYASTISTATAAGRTLTRSSVQTRVIGIVVESCHGCGTLAVYWRGKLLKTVSLNASATTYKRSILIRDLGSVQSGTLVLKTTSGRSYVDGVELSRS